MIWITLLMNYIAKKRCDKMNWRLWYNLEEKTHNFVFPLLVSVKTEINK